MLLKRTTVLSVVHLALLAAVAPASARRLEYSATLGGIRKPGAEVCFVRIDGGADAFEYFLSYRDRVRCLSADRVLDVPAGGFHVFVRHPEGYVSETDDFVSFAEDAPERGYKLLETPLTEAGVFDVSSVAASLGSKQSMGVWLPPTDTTRAMFIPLVPHELTMLIPAGHPFVPLLTERGLPVRIGEAMTLAPGEHKTFDRFPSPENGFTDVVTWIKVEPALARRAKGKAVDTPAVLLSTGLRAQTPVFPVALPLSSSRTFLIYKHVPIGSARLSVVGTFWEWFSAEVSVTASGGTQVVRTPVVLNPAGAAQLRLAPELLANNASCRAPNDRPETSKSPRFDVSLSRCTGQASDPCATRAKPISYAVTAWPKTLQQLSVGEYTVEVQVPDTTTVTAQIRVEPGTVTDVELKPQTVFPIYGRITLAGKPIAALVQFATGRAVSDPQTGEYHAELLADPLTNLIDVEVCGEKITFTKVLTDRPLPNTPLDINIPNTRILVRTVSEGDRPLPQADVRFAVLKDRHEAKRYYSSPSVTTDNQGQAELVNVPDDKLLKICAHRTDTDDKCTDPFELREIDATKPVVLKLNQRQYEGIVTPTTGFDLIYWITPQGRVSEHVISDNTGHFYYSQKHTSPEYIVVVSRQQPLFVTAVPEEPTGNVEITRSAQSPISSFEIGVDSNDPAGRWVLGLWVSGYYVPREVLAAHTDVRGSVIDLRAGERSRITDIVRSGPIHVAIAPDLCFTRRGDPSCTDPFVLAEYANVRRYEVADRAITIRP